MQMVTIAIHPGSMEVISPAVDKFGDSRVITGEWNEPVRLINLSTEEAAFAQKFFEDMGYCCFSRYW